MFFLKNKMILRLTLSVLMITAFSVVAKDNIKLSKQQLEQLSNKLEKKRLQYHIPGMAIAIVKDDKVIFAKGYGVSNLKSNNSVSTNTLFGIGSTSKAFTSTMIGMLVDDGKMEWDSPVTEYLPYLEFSTENKEEKITIRDMLSHQTGFTRFNLLYANEKIGRNEVLHDSIKAKPWAGFREKFLYTNLMYVGAGVASAESVNTNWEDLLDDRILKPLGMNSTISRYSELKKSPKLSSGYMWQEENKAHKLLELRDLKNIAPAGAIHSNVIDMAQWLRFQLGSGAFDGKKLISSQQLEETKTAQIKISPNAAYGMGWVLTKYKDQKVIFHDGSVEGYSAIVAMLPEANLGFVLLTNLTSTPFLNQSMGMIWEQLQQPQSSNDIQTDKQDTDYSDYAGDYIANFGSFKDVIFKLSVKHNILALDVPGQTVYQLKMPNNEGKWFFAITDSVSVSFEKNQQGEVSLMRMHQNGMDFELPRKGYPIIAEITPDELQPFLGSYKVKENVEVKMLIQNHRLAMDVPGEMVYELHLPDSKGFRKFRINSGLSIKFNTNKKGKITSYSQYRAGKKMYTASRSIDKNAKNENLPSVSDINQLRDVGKRRKALIHSSGFQLKGKITFLQSGVEGKIQIGFDSEHNSYERLDLGKYGSTETIVGKNGAITKSTFTTNVKHIGKYLTQMQKAHPAASYYWEKWYNDIKVVKSGEIGDRKVYKLELKGEETQSAEVVVDAVTGDILRQKTNLLVPSLGSLPTIMTFNDYREVNGLRLPFKVTLKNNFNGKIVIEYDTFKANVIFAKDDFNTSGK